MPRRNGTGIGLLADPTRRQIVALLALGHRRPAKLAAEIGLSGPATSRQLRLLQEAGLISSRRGYVDRRQIVYYIEPVRLGQITAWLAGTEVGRDSSAAQSALTKVFASSNHPTPPAEADDAA